MSALMPAIYIPHGGGPCFFMQGKEHWASLENYLRQIASGLPATPKAILVVSAHWLEQPVQVTANSKPALIYDYYGFPQSTYALKYPAIGDPKLAQQIAELLRNKQIDCQLNAQRGWDHGVFVPLLIMYPNANIPVVQLSLNSQLDPADHLAIGQALSSLREQGVLIVGSGMSFHNMRAYGNSAFTPISAVFDQWLSQSMQLTGEARKHAILNWQSAPQARACHPDHAEEHLIPLFVVAGAASESVGVCTYKNELLKTIISAFEFA